MLVFLLMLGACGAPKPAPKPPPPKPPEPEPVSKHQAVNPLVDGSEERPGKIKTWGVMGTIDRQVTEKGLGVRFPAVVGCFERQVKKEPYLGGQMKLSFRVDSKGKVKQIFVVESDLVDVWTAKAARRENAELVRTLVGTASYFNPNDADVRYRARRLGDDNWILYVGNMERLKDASPVIGLPVAAGEYRITICSSDEGGRGKIEVHRGLMNSKETATVHAMRKFSLALAPGELQLIRIEKE